VKEKLHPALFVDIDATQNPDTLFIELCYWVEATGFYFYEHNNKPEQISGPEGGFKGRFDNCLQGLVQRSSRPFAQVH
jgi:hypothetical protein